MTWKWSKSLVLQTVLFGIGFLLYAQSITFEFTLDDKIYITQNSFVKQGTRGLGDIWTTDLMEGYEGANFTGLLAGGRYRPLSLSIHALEQEVHQNNPAFAHLLNALICGLLAVAVYLFFNSLLSLQKKNQKLAQWGAFAGSLLYTVHPLHVEVVANISKRDDLLSTFLGVLALYFGLIFFRKRNFSYAISSGLLLLLGLLTKEAAINFVPLFILLALLFKQPLSLKWPQLKRISITWGVALILFFGLRHMAINSPAEADIQPNLLNQVYANANPQERVAGILYTYGLGLKLNAIPYPLTHDYYPYHPFRSYTDLQRATKPYPQLNEWRVWGSGALLLLLLALFVNSFIRRNKSQKHAILAFSIGGYLASTLIYANIFFEIGAFFNERFLFVASLCSCLLFGYGLMYLHARRKKFSQTILILISIAFAGLSLARQMDWQDDEHLVLADVKTSTGSARANLLAAEASLNLHHTKADLNLLNPAFPSYLKQGLHYAQRALDIYPEYTAPHDILGNLQYELGNKVESFDHFRIFYAQKPTQQMWENMLFIAQSELQQNEAEQSLGHYKQMAEVAQSNTHQAQAFAQIGKLFGQHFNNIQSSIFYLEKAVQLMPSEKGYLEDLGTAYAINNNPRQAVTALRKAEALGASSGQLFQNLSLLYQQLNRQDSASYYLNKAKNPL